MATSHFGGLKERLQAYKNWLQGATLASSFRLEPLRVPAKMIGFYIATSELKTLGAREVKTYLPDLGALDIDHEEYQGFENVDCNNLVALLRLQAFEFAD